MKEDLKWCDRFIYSFNGKAMVIRARDEPELVVGTDSSLSGFAAVWQTDWLSGC